MWEVILLQIQVLDTFPNFLLNVRLNTITTRFESVFRTSEDSMEVDDCVVNLKQLENTFTRNRVMVSLRLSEAATQQVSIITKPFRNADRENVRYSLMFLWLKNY